MCGQRMGRVVGRWRGGRDGRGPWLCECRGVFLGVADFKSVIRSMPICFFFEFAMEYKDVVHQSVLKFLHILLLAFAAHKFFPCAEQILDGDDTLVTMSELDPPNRTPPQRLLPLLERIKS